MPRGLETHFAPAARLGEAEMAAEVRAVSHHAVIEALLGTVAGLLAVLNEHRQVLALNPSLLEMLGVGEAAEVLGLRLGEAVRCVHAHEMPGGCGTGESCATCGAAIAQVTSLATNGPVRRTCALEVHRNGAREDLFLRVCATPLVLEGHRLLLLFLQDVTREQHLAVLDRVFSHDLRNTVTGLVGTSELLAQEPFSDDVVADMAADVARLSRRVAREIEIQRLLAGSSAEGYEACREDWSVASLLAELRTMCAHHPAAAGRVLDVAPGPEVVLRTDGTVLLRVLCNMVINALEATPPGGTVRVRVLVGEGAATFSVWNAGAIEPAVGRRIFQRNFSTKESIGRGLGTYSMKLLGERILQGEVGFSSTPAEGTRFWIRLPARF